MDKTINAAFESKKEADFLALVDDNADMDDFASPAKSKGRADQKAFFGMFTKAFPDQKHTTTNALGVEDFVITEGSLSATHKGALGPIKATNKPVTLHGVFVGQVKDGKFIHAWHYSNSAELLMQIGLIPPPGSAPPGAAPAKAPAAAPAAAAPAAPKQ
jgi:predicted ester cyclase